MTTRNRERPVDWKRAAPPPPPGSETFLHQGSLEKLPVLQLQPTLETLRSSLRAVAWTQEEYDAAVTKIDEFGAPRGMGETLQAQLEEYAKHREHWLEEWWDDVAYLKYRDPVVVNVSYYYGFDDHPVHLPQRATHRAAALARATLLWRAKLKQGLIAADSVKEGPLCMDTYRWMFDCCRVPSFHGDFSYTYATKDQTGVDGHIIVIRKGSIWKVEAAHDGQLLTTGELEEVMRHIVTKADKQEWKSVGVLPSNHRDAWAKDYAKLISNHQNDSLVRDIHSSAFIVSLDEAKPDGPVEFSEALWYGGPEGVGLRNRWVDKPVQLIIYDNGKAGIMGEHSVMDGTPTVRLCDDILEALARPDFDHGDIPGSPITLAPEERNAKEAVEVRSHMQHIILGPEKGERGVGNLHWIVDAELDEAVNEAVFAAKRLCESQALGFLLTPYGKRDIKASGFGPDSWTQMVIQLAYARLLRRWPTTDAAPALDGGVRLPGGTYEAATTRRFHKGRTEAIRVVTAASRAWVAAMLDESADANTRKELFRAAVKKHGADARAAGSARGIDRHLLGLRMLAQKVNIDVPLFRDPLVQRASKWVLSTSAIFSKHFPVYGWGEVVPDGFGVAYMTGYDDRLQFTITSRKEMPNAEFVAEIARAADDVRTLFADTSSSEGKSKL